jgi:hypothetical protein
MFMPRGWEYWFCFGKALEFSHQSCKARRQGLARKRIVLPLENVSYSH